MIITNDFVDYRHQQKLKLRKSLIALSAMFFFCYGMINIFDDIILISIVEYSLSFCSVYAYFKFDKWSIKVIERFTFIFINIVFIYLSFILVFDGVEKGSHIWLIIMPITSYLLMGLKWGMRLSFFYLLFAVIVLSVRHFIKPSLLNLEYLLDCVAPYFWVWVAAHVYETAVNKGQSSLFEIATKDSLTSMLNRRAFYNYFDNSNDRPLVLMIIDLDYFKSINDNHGHDAGDYVLKYVADKLSHLVNDKVDVFRIGGEEFAILLSEYELSQAVTIANELLEDLRAAPVRYKHKEIKVTASIGIATGAANCELAQLTKQADECLYQAKHNGRDRVVYEL